MTLSKELSNLGVKVIDQSKRESNLYGASFYIVFNKDVSFIIPNGEVIFRAFSKDNYELVSGLLEQPDFGLGADLIREDTLNNQGYVYTQFFRNMDSNLIKKISVEIYHK